MMGTPTKVLGICLRDVPAYKSRSPAVGAEANEPGGRRDWLVVLGEAGSGKTSLLADRARACAAYEEVIWVDLSLLHDPEQVDDLNRVIREQRRGRAVHIFCDGVDEGIHPPDDTIRRTATVIQGVAAKARGLRLSISCRKWWWTEWMTIRLEQACAAQNDANARVRILDLPEPAWSRAFAGVPHPAQAADSLTPLPERLRESAADLAAAMVLGGQRLLGDSGAPLVLDVRSLIGQSDGLPPHVEQLIAAVLLVRDGAFIRFRHWAQAEYLAATKLSKSPSIQARGLLAPDRDFPIPGCAVAVPLLPVAGWLTLLSDGFREWMAAEDPEDLLVVDRFVLTEATRQALVAGLLMRETRHRNGLPALAGLAHPTLGDQVRAALRGAHEGEPGAARALLALHIAEANALGEAAADIEAIIRGPRQDDEGITLRVVAVQALSKIDATRTWNLRTALPPVDTHLRVASEILTHLVPLGLDAATVVAVVRASGLANWQRGMLEFFEYGLPELLDTGRIDDEALVVALCESLARSGSAEGDPPSEAPDKLVAAVLRAAWRLGDSAVVRDAALGLVWKLGEAHRRQVPSIWSEHEVESTGWEPSARRRFWWEALVGLALSTRDRSGGRDLVGGAIRAWDALPTLLGSEALADLVGLLCSESDGDRAEILDVWVWSAFRLDSDEHCALAESALAGPASSGRVKIERRFSRLAGGRSAWAAARTASSRPTPRPDGPPPLDRIRLEVGGDGPPGSRWWKVIHLLSADPETRRLGDPWRGTLPRMRGVAAAVKDDTLRDRITSLAICFLEQEDPQTETWWTKDSFPGLLLAGVRAAQWVVWQDAGNSVSKAAWSTWAPALIVTGDLVGSGSQREALRELIVANAPEACLKMVERITASEDETRRRIEVSRAAGLGAPGVDAELVRMFRNGQLDTRSDFELVDALLLRGVPAAAEAALSRLTAGDREALDRRANAGRALLARQPGLAAAAVIRALRGDERLFTAMLPELLSPFAATKDWMRLVQSEDLEWLFQHARGAETRREDDDVDPVHGQWVAPASLPRAGAPWVFVSAMRERAVKEDILALARMVETAREDRTGLHRALEEARSAYARHSWRPCDAGEVSVALATNGRASQP